MFKNNKTIVFFIIFLIFLFFLFSFGSTLKEVEKLDSSSLIKYQQNPCSLNLYNFLKVNKYDSDFVFKFDGKSDPNCFGKIKYVEPINDDYLIFIGTNSYINLILQSLIWFSLIALIKKSNYKIMEPSFITIFSLTFLFTFIFIYETSFNASNNNNFSTEFKLQNYSLINYFLITLIIFLLIDEILLSRIKSLINYFPFLILIGGVYENLNLNFFVLVLSYFGTKYLKKFIKTYPIVSISYFLLLAYWSLENKQVYKTFDVDKLRGFLATTNSGIIIFLWGIVFYLVLLGFLYIFKNSELNFINISKNFYKTGFWVVLIGLISTNTYLLNLFSYFVFGQTKLTKVGLNSVSGNAWRGLLPSAESAGEIYAIILFIAFWNKYKLNQKFEKNDILFLIFIFYGFIRANNIAALISIVIIVFYIIIRKKIKLKILRTFTYLILTLVFFVSSFFILRQNYYSIMGQAVVNEGWINSNIYDGTLIPIQEVNQLLAGRDFKTLIYTFEGTNLVSTSLINTSKILVSENNIYLIPNPISVLGVAGLFINRAEKWGIFLATYNPEVENFLFGYGPLNLVNYFNDIKIIDNSLVLPHSSLFSYIIFFGFVPLSCLIYLIIRRLIKYGKNESISTFIVIFMIINFLKSDSILYLSNFLTFVFFVHLLEIEETEK